MEAFQWFCQQVAASPPPVNPCLTYPLAQGHATITNGGPANGIYAFFSGPCPWIYTNVGVSFGWAAWLIWTGVVGPTEYFIQITNFGIQQQLGFSASVPCNGSNFSGSYLLSGGATVTFGP